MTKYNRRTFIQHAAMLVATTACLDVYPRLATATEPAPNWQGASHPFFAAATNTPEVIAHRGGNGQWPGETMRAFRGAAGLNVDILELDVFISENGELVVMHDEDVSKTTAGSGKINKLHSGYLQTLNAGHNWSPDGKHYPYRNKSVSDSQYADLKVPLLSDVFAEFKNYRMIIEMKKAHKSPAQALSTMISDDMKNNVLVASFEGKFMNEFRGLRKDVATSFSLSIPDALRLISGKKISEFDAGQPSAIELPYQLITEDIVRLAHQRNIKVHAWTVNKRKKMSQMNKIGVDGIITDYPGTLLALLGRAT